MSGQSKEPVPQEPQSPQAGCLSTIARIVWMMVGNAALLVLVALIALKRSFSALDIAYWATVVALLVIRYVDIKYLKGLTTNVQPATMKDWSRHARLLFMIAGGVWAVVRFAVLFLGR